jgi:sec-independent protein translocase protein TatB
MFNIGMGEILIILAVAFLVVGPKDLPKIARWLGKTVKFAKRAFAQLRDAVDLDDESREVKEAGKILKETAEDLNPLKGINSGEGRKEDAG